MPVNQRSNYTPELTLAGLASDSFPRLSGNSLYNTQASARAPVPPIPNFWTSSSGSGIVPPLPPIRPSQESAFRPTAPSQRRGAELEMEYNRDRQQHIRRKDPEVSDWRGPRESLRSPGVPLPPTNIGHVRETKLHKSRSRESGDVDFDDLSDTIAQIRAMAQGPARNAIRECEEKAAREVNAMHATMRPQRSAKRTLELSIAADSQDVERMKKKRRLIKNRESAQRSRDKKARYIKCLEHKMLEEIEEKMILQKRNQMLLHQCMRLREAYQKQSRESVQIIDSLRKQCDGAERAAALAKSPKVEPLPFLPFSGTKMMAPPASLLPDLPPARGVVGNSNS